LTIGDAPLQRVPPQAESAHAVNPAGRVFRAGLIDAFLAADDASALLDFAIANEARFRASTVTLASGKGGVDDAIRRSFDFLGPDSEWSGALDARLRERFGEIAAAAGVPRFEPGEIEMTLSAYRDGCYYRRHLDAAFGPERKGQGIGRRLTAVFYVFREPKRFEGGELALFPLAASGEPQTLAPAHNRLVTFPTFVPHEVNAVSVPSGAFADARFSVNCWFRRADD
jgi:Rps23 Pro-64 3,4-dihydroxylase Tpa1-like proline 4-hydroxylase